MTSRLRQDALGAWHHVFARGMARRTVFESRRDVRVLKCLLAKEVRRGTLEVHAFCFMGTHLHLLLRSRTGELSAALKRVFNGYVRWFNRSRRRDGSLFRGRFGSRLVTSDTDRLNVIAYLDANPVAARLSTTPEAYEHGSATYWATGRVPIWFATEFVARALGGRPPASPGAWDGYRRLFGPRGGPAHARLIEARMSRRDLEPDPLDDLVGAAPARVYAWMVRKAALADQTRPGLPVLDPQTVDEVWRSRRASLAGEVRGQRGRGRPLALVARIALLRDLSGLRYDAIARRTSTTGTHARNCYRSHASRLASDRTYAAACSDIATAALAVVHAAAPHFSP